MIRDIFIITSSGIPLYHGHFGECHSINSDSDMFSGLITAIQMFCQELGGSDIRHLEMEKRRIFFHRTKQYLYALVAEHELPGDILKKKIIDIANIFEDTYKKILNVFDNNVTPFKNFGEILIENQIVTKNCGKHPSCEVCQNHTKSLPIDECRDAINNYCSDE